MNAVAIPQAIKRGIGRCMVAAAVIAELACLVIAAGWLVALFICAAAGLIAALFIIGMRWGFDE